MAGDYKTVAVPEDLEERIRRIIQIRGLGFRSKQEFVVSALREKLAAIEAELRTMEWVQSAIGDDPIEDLEQRGDSRD